MKCPFCNAPDTRVIDSRLAAEGYQVRRRRECPHCEERFTTYEGAELVMPQVHKRGGETEPFDEKKLRRGLEHATYKTTVSPDQIEIVLNHVMHKLRTLGEREVDSGKIGNWVMKELHDLDQVAFVRFAAVYKNFQDVDEFRRELDQLDSEPTPELSRRQMRLPVSE